MDWQAIGIGGIGGTAMLAAFTKLYGLIASTKAGADGQKLGTEYQSHMFSRMVKLEEENTRLNKIITDQATHIGSLETKVADLNHKVAGYEDAKGLLAKITISYEKLKGENAEMTRRLEAAGLHKTGRDGRPYLPSGGRS